jgi:hypothetical protein
VCGCAERRELIGTAVRATRRGDVAAVRMAAAQFKASTVADARELRQAAAVAVKARLAALRAQR